MTKREKLKRWRKLIAAKQWKIKDVAGRLGVATQTAYNWNCGSQEIPDARLIQLESLE